MNFNKFNEKLLGREVIFHDKWANLENINNIDVYKLFESITVVENKFIISHIGTLAEKILGFKPKYSNKESLIRNYKWYIENLDQFKNQKGVSHHVPWKQGILKIAKIFF